VANGDIVVSEGKCSGLRAEMNNHVFSIDSYVIVLAGCDMVLGI
jgi:hypothetical protein